LEISHIGFISFFSGSNFKDSFNKEIGENQPQECEKGAGNLSYFRIMFRFTLFDKLLSGEEYVDE
jgi:hypothetical protein